MEVSTGINLSKLPVGDASVGLNISGSRIGDGDRERNSDHVHLESSSGSLHNYV